MSGYSLLTLQFGEAATSHQAKWGPHPEGVESLNYDPSRERGVGFVYTPRQAHELADWIKANVPEPEPSWEVRRHGTTTELWGNGYILVVLDPDTGVISMADMRQGEWFSPETWGAMIAELWRVHRGEVAE